MVTTTVNADLDPRVLLEIIGIQIESAKQGLDLGGVMPDALGGFSETDMRVLGLISGLITAAMFNATHHEYGELYRRATHDALTGIANRSLFYDRLRQALAHAQRLSQRVAVLNLDMDGLKPIDDTHGHRAGIRRFAKWRSASAAPAGSQTPPRASAATNSE
jgi:hypothetical protein